MPSMTCFPHLLIRVLLTLIVLGVLAVRSYAGSDLFGDEYWDCPSRLRLHDQMTELAVERDGECPCTVNVSWTGTHPDTWGLGTNTYNTSIVVLLDDGRRVYEQRLPLSKQSTSFPKIQYDDKLRVQTAIITTTDYGQYIVSDILEQRLGRMLAGPEFKTDIHFSWRTEPFGTFYYVGYGKAFNNYRANGLITEPSPARFRVGLVHGGGSRWYRKGAGFHSYVLNIRDSDGDVVPSGHDGRAWDSDYGEQRRDILNRILLGAIDGTLDFTKDGSLLVNVRVNDEGRIHTAMQRQIGNLGFKPNAVKPNNQGLTFNSLGNGGDMLWAYPPDVFRDFPANVLSSDETYDISAWAENEDGEIISLVSVLTLRPQASKLEVGTMTDYLNKGTSVSDAYVVDFTVIE